MLDHLEFPDRFLVEHRIQVGIGELVLGQHGRHGGIAAHGTRSFFLFGEVLEVMLALARDEGMTMVVVSHEMGFSRAAANRVIFMEEGVILVQGPPEKIFSDPDHPRIKEFLSSLEAH